MNKAFYVLLLILILLFITGGSGSISEEPTGDVRFIYNVDTSFINPNLENIWKTRKQLLMQGGKEVTLPVQVTVQPAPTVLEQPAPTVLEQPAPKVLAPPAPKVLAPPAPKVLEAPAPKIVITEQAPKAPKVLAAPAPKVLAPPAPKIVITEQAPKAAKVLAPTAPTVLAQPAPKIVITEQAPKAAKAAKAVSQNGSLPKQGLTMPEIARQVVDKKCEQRIGSKMSMPPEQVMMARTLRMNGITEAMSLIEPIYELPPLDEYNVEGTDSFM